MLGVLLLCVGHGLLALVTLLIDGDAAIKVFHRGSLVFIGASQLVYGVPLALALRKRRPLVALGAVVGLGVTVLVNAWGLGR